MANYSKDDEIKEKWPLHFLVFINDLDSIKFLFRINESHHTNLIEQLDLRGNTPLMLAVYLEYIEIVRYLLRKGARVSILNTAGWSIVHESIAKSNYEMTSELLRYRDSQILSDQQRKIPLLLDALSKTTDFYVEMKWEFTSWLPFVSRICPSDIYKVWKSGKCLRVDSTLTGFEDMNWKRGHISLLFNLTDSSANISQVDHDSQAAFTDSIKLFDENFEKNKLAPLPPSHESVYRRLNSAITSTILKTDGTIIARNRQGILFRSDKTEKFNGIETGVFSISGVQIISRQRTEHLSDKLKNQMKLSFNPLQNIFGFMNQQSDIHSKYPSSVPIDINNCKSNKTTTFCDTSRPKIVDYFFPSFDKDDKMIDVCFGNVPEVTEKNQKFKGTVWLAENYPLSVKEHIVPIVDLLSLNIPHFTNLKDFLLMGIPSGFPIKLELPLYHVMIARVSFQNYNCCDVPIPYVNLQLNNEDCYNHINCDNTNIIDENSLSNLNIINRTTERLIDNFNHKTHLTCIIDPDCFQIPPTYRGSSHGTFTSTLGGGYQDADDEMLQLAIRQSIKDSQDNSTAHAQFPTFNKKEFQIEGISEEEQLSIAVELSNQNYDEHHHFDTAELLLIHNEATNNVTIKVNANCSIIQVPLNSLADVEHENKECESYNILMDEQDQLERALKLSLNYK